MAKTMILALLTAGGAVAQERGAGVCAGCHPAIFQKQQASRHAQSLRQPERIPELMEASPFRLDDRPARATLTVARGASGRLEMEASREGESARLTWLWAFGSGAKGITPVGRREDGALVESRLSWYAANRGLGFTTGSTRRQPASAAESLGRALTTAEVKECFGCHTSGYAPERPEPTADEMGVRCERCHGPGGAHVRAMEGGSRKPGGTILHPGRMEAFEQVQLCGVCHGRPPADSDVRALAAIERNPNSVRFPSQRIMLSRCFNETPGGLACSGCHDAHADAPSSEQAIDGVCLRCHQGPPRRSCPKSSRNCSSCHMPKESVMMHSRFSDHWIRVVRRDGQ